MANISQYFQPGASIDYTPAAATYAGNLVNLGAVCGFTPRDIAASALGAVAVTGVIRAPYIGGIVCNIGDNVYWDANGTPYGGAADGACTCNAAAVDLSAGLDWWVGTLVRATTATGATCDVALNLANPNLPAWLGKLHITTAADLTLVAATHSGGVIHVTADAGTDTKITLPTGVVGMDWVIQSDEADGGNLLQVDLDGNEIIAGQNLTIAATKLALNTKLTANRGDYLHLVCNVAATSWRCVGIRGIWVTS
ncbi:MAG TPA: DUF2190 family protein [Phycisphaerae bacterium]|nr:DUF2190 family protein [Phycisphaerae bacterium]